LHPSPFGDAPGPNFEKETVTVRPTQTSGHEFPLELDKLDRVHVVVNQSMTLVESPSNKRFGFKSIAIDSHHQYFFYSDHRQRPKELAQLGAVTIAAASLPLLY
jgi:hypothetical protein